MHDINVAERTLLELIRNDSRTVNTVIGYLRYTGKSVLASSKSEYETLDAQRLLRFTDVLAAAVDERRAHT